MPTKAVIAKCLDRQTGKTTVAASIVKGLVAMGIDAVYVAPNLQQAQETAKQFDIPQGHYVAWSSLSIRERLARATTIVLDDAQLFCLAGAEDPVETCKSAQAHNPNPCQVIVFY